MKEKSPGFWKYFLIALLQGAGDALLGALPIWLLELFLNYCGIFPTFEMYWLPLLALFFIFGFYSVPFVEWKGYHNQRMVREQNCMKQALCSKEREVELSLKKLERELEQKKKDELQKEKEEILRIERDRKVRFINSIKDATAESIHKQYSNKLESMQDKIDNIKIECERKLNEKASEYRLFMKSRDKEVEKLESKIKSSIDQYKYMLSSISKISSDLQLSMQQASPFMFSASLQADVAAIPFLLDEYFMKHKNNPSTISAKRLSVLKNVAKEHVIKFKEMQYKYEFLLETFPELKYYIDDENALAEMAQNMNSLNDIVNEVKENEDAVRQYLTSEEWNKLDNVQRNQLALDRWKKSTKSKWTIGMLYEMYIAYEFRKAGYSVEEYGIKHGLNDLGRDLIATNGYETYIVQCKNWSADKLIHENVVCQLFGTSMHYKINNNDMSKEEENSLFRVNVVPVLITTAPLSETANQFAKALGVKVRIVEFSDFPMIKCNVNGTNKIYHLPFDQQYWRTQISNPGEFYAASVAEAEKNGFRRAMRHSVAQ